MPALCATLGVSGAIHGAVAADAGAVGQATRPVLAGDAVRVAGAVQAGDAVRVAGPVQVTGAWIRWLPAGVPGGGYMTLVAGAAGDVLLGADSADYGEISFHQTTHRDGMNEMLPVASVELPPQTPVHFAAGGYHLMLMRPTRELAPGDRVIVTLRFAHAAPLAVPFAVKAGNLP